MKTIQDYQFSLPKSLIAETAASPAPSAKMMTINRKTGQIIHEGTFWDLPDQINKNSVLFFNNSRVVRSRIVLSDFRGEKPSGEEYFFKNAEIFFLESIDKNHFSALVRPGKKFKIGTKIYIDDVILEIVENTQSGRIIAISGSKIDDFLEKYGQLPLPPYIEYSQEKEKDYQSVFASKNGSVAAPTASLHFNQELLEKISQPKFFVTLHIGLGTFRTIDTEKIADYSIHSEKAEVNIAVFSEIFSLKSAGKQILAIGTTACRTLESLPSLWLNVRESICDYFDEAVCIFWDKIAENSDSHWVGEFQIIKNTTLKFATRAYITPGYEWKIVDELVTNFHLPESSLLVLVSAFMGHDNTMKIYDYAVKNTYRFFSFGDGMYIKKL